MDPLDRRAGYTPTQRSKRVNDGSVVLKKSTQRRRQQQHHRVAAPVRRIRTGAAGYRPAGLTRYRLRCPGTDTARARTLQSAL